MQQDYTYQVARIRALETGLLSDADIDQIISAQDVAGAKALLQEHGWGRASGEESTEDMLASEEEKIWETVSDLHIDMALFDVLLLPRKFHNVKAAVKLAATGDTGAALFYEDAGISGEELVNIIRDKDFDKLPDSMKDAAGEAYDALAKTGDGQLCDIIMDRACLDAVREAGQEAAKKGYEILGDYAEDQVAVSDIKIAVRAAATGKSREFLERALADCQGLSREQLIKASQGGTPAIKEYLEGTDYREGAEALSGGVSAFEKWCDDRIMETLKSQKYETFTIGPVIAYVLARENEIKTVRMILACRENGLTEDEIRERKREMYV